MIEMQMKCKWVRSFDGHFNIGCVNNSKCRGNGNFKTDEKIKDTKWDFKYCPYCGMEIDTNKKQG